VPVTGCHPARRVHGVEAARADLVGPGQHAHRVDRRAVGQLVVVERLQEAHVGVVQVAHQVEHGVGRRRLVVVRGQERVGAGRQVGRDRPDARGVDQRDLGQVGRRPPDLQPVQVVGADGAEVDLQLVVPPAERALAG
jgi:hypothetical protein